MKTPGFKPVTHMPIGVWHTADHEALQVRRSLLFIAGAARRVGLARAGFGMRTDRFGVTWRFSVDPS